MPWTDTRERPTEAASRTCRRLRLIWQDERTRRFIHVGTLDQLSDDSYTFSYTEDAAHEAFLPLAEFPDLTKQYFSQKLPAFFSNRVMSPRRQSYQQYCSWLGLEDVPTPIEILVRDGGGRVTDTFHVVDDFRPVNGRVEGHFMVSGVRHVVSQEFPEQIEGEELELRPEPTNSTNEQAVLLLTRGRRAVGYIPDWLLGDVWGWGLEHTRVLVEQVNEQAPPHLKVLCRIEADLEQ